MTDLSDLIARVEGATGPSLELDADVRAAFPRVPIPEGNTIAAERSGRHWTCVERDSVGGLVCFHQMPAFTASVDAALALIGEKLPGWTWTLTYWPPDGAEPGFTRVTLGGPGYISDEWVHDTFEVMREGQVPALALTLALLKGVQSREDQGSKRCAFQLGSPPNPTDGTVASSRGGG